MAISEIEKLYCQQLIKHYDKLSISGLPDRNIGLSEVPLEKIFIKLNVSVKSSIAKVGYKEFMPIDLSSEGLARFDRPILSEKSITTLEFVQKQLRLFEQARTDKASLSLTEALDRYHHLMILGRPGSGKTTLTRWLTLNFAKNQMDHKGISGSYLHQARLPILLELRDFADCFRKHSQQPFIVDLKEEIANFVSNDSRYGKPPPEFIANALTEGRCLLLLDGLDEIADPNAQESLIRSINAFFLAPEQNHQANLCIVTARPHGYQAGTLFASIRQCSVNPFSGSDVHNFIRHWYETAYNDYETQDPEKLIKAIESNPNVNQLAYNPLLCTIIVLIYRNSRVLPNRRTELYLKCCEVLLDTWERNKNIPDSELIIAYDWQTKLDLLAPVAWWLHSETQRYSATEESFVHKLASVLKKKRLVVNDIEANEHARKFITVIRNRSGLLQDRGDGTLEFMHRTFQEYLAARYIADQPNPDYIDLIMEHLNEAWWYEVHLLVIGYLGSGSSGSEKASTLLQTILTHRHTPVFFLQSFALQTLVPKRISWIYNKYKDRKVIKWLIEGFRLVILFPFIACIWISRLLHGWQMNSRLEWALQRDFEVVISGYLDCNPMGVHPTTVGLIQKQAQALWLRSLYDDSINTQLLVQLISSPIHSTAFDKGLITELLNSTNDKVKSVRLKAIDVLGKLGQITPQIIEGLLYRLDSNDLDERIEAAIALGMLGQSNPQIITELLAALDVMQKDVRLAAVNTLGTLGVNSPRVIEELLSTLSDNDEDVYRASLEALGKLGRGSSQVVKQLLHALNDNNWYTCFAAAEALGTLGQSSPQVIKELLNALSDGDWDVRVAAASALGALGQSSPGVIEGLLSALSDNNWYVSRSAAAALDKLDQSSPQVKEELLRGLADSDWSIRLTSSIGLGKLGKSSPQVIEGLWLALDDSDSEVRRAAATALGTLGQSSPRVIEGLLSALASTEWYVRLAAVNTLGTLGVNSPRVIEELLSTLSDNDEDVYRASLEALGKLGRGSSQVVKQLLHALNDNNWYIRLAVAEALGTLGQSSPQVIKELLNALSDGDWDVRVAAASALGALGQNSPGVIEGLLSALVANEGVVRLAAAVALAKLGQSTSSVIDGLLSVLNVNNWNVRLVAINALGELGEGSSHVIEQLLKVQMADEGDVRLAATKALGKLGQNSPELVEWLLGMLSTNSEDLRLAVTESLGKLAQSLPQVVERLLDLLVKGDRKVQNAAVEALGKLGQTSPAVVKRLLSAVNVSNWDVRYTAVETLGKITIKDDILFAQVIMCLHKELYGFNNLRQPALKSLKQLLDGRQLPGEKWVPLRKRQERRRAFNRAMHWVILGAGVFLAAYGLAFLDETNMIIKVITVAGGIIGIGAGVAQIVGKSLRNPWE